MEQKNRMRFTIAVVLLIFGALLMGFGRSLFQLDTPDVVLPSVGQSSPDGPAAPEDDPYGAQQTVSVTPQTVQSVIATLERTDSYYREVQVEQFWPGGGSAYTVHTWVDRDRCRSTQTLPSGAVRHDLIGPEQVYTWYDGSSRYITTPAGDNAADLTQHLPTYETVLELDPTAITAAGYERREDLPCIYVRSALSDGASTAAYWVSVDSGLLICAELRRGEDVVYRMTAPDLQSPCPADADFSLPDGTTPQNP